MKMKQRMLPIRREKITLRYPESADFEEFSLRARASIVFHEGLVSPPFKHDEFESYVESGNSPAERHFLIIENCSDVIAGVVNLSQIFLKGFCSAYLGYYLFYGFEGRGLMSEALEAVVDYGFGTVGLHRLEANIQPHNKESKRLVERCGFTKEGFSRNYLRVDGDWRDHERWAIIAEDWKHTES